MAKFLFWSDLHLNFRDFEIPIPGQGGAPAREALDAILLPGDIDERGRHVDFMKSVHDIWGLPVLAVAGNHEPYGAKRFQKHMAAEREAIFAAQADGYDIDVLRMGERIVGDTRILGTTLWTDMALWGPVEEWHKRLIADEMNDYRHVRWFCERTGIYRKMIPNDTIAMHKVELAWLLARLDVPFAGPTVVMTHHLPIREIVAEHRLDRKARVTAAYASDLLATIIDRDFTAWISGHSHDAREGVFTGSAGPRAFVSNIRGYPHEQTGFLPLRVLDSHAPVLCSELSSDDEPDPEFG